MSLINRIFGTKKAPKAVNKLTHEDVKKRSKEIQDKIRLQTLSRIKVNINRWTYARQRSETRINPDNTDAARVHRDIEIDAHLWALMQTLRLKVIANDFTVFSEDKEVDEETTYKFKKKWFRNLIKHAVDSEFYGFSLVQLGDIVNGCYVDSELVPREYVVQQRDGIKKNLGDYTNLIPYNEGIYANWLIPIGEKRNLGLLDKAAPLVIKKKEVITAWSEAAEVFGMPIRIGKTSLQDEGRRQNMEDMLDNMGSAAWAVIDDDDDVELVDTSKTDISNMFDKFIERVNSELSKLILSQTGTTDEKTHVGSAGVMENVLKDIVQSYIVKIEDIANEQLLPLMQKQGIAPLGCYLKAANEQKLSMLDLWGIVKELIPTVNIPNEWISETFGIPIEELAKGEKVDEKAQALLRSSAEGVTALVEVARGVSQGVLELSAAVAIVMKVYGVDKAEAAVMIGNPKPMPKEAKFSTMKETSNLYEGILKDCC
jgi:phage gp29-like protein